MSTTRKSTMPDRKSTRLNSSHLGISYAVFCLKKKDIQLYHLGLGAGADPMDPRQLRYLIDETPQVLPTSGNVAASFHMTKTQTVQFPAMDIELSKLLHASEQVRAPAPLPPSGSAQAVTRFTDIWDKGKAAVIWSETRVNAPDGTLLCTLCCSIFGDHRDLHSFPTRRSSD